MKIYFSEEERKAARRETFRKHDAKRNKTPERREYEKQRNEKRKLTGGPQKSFERHLKSSRGISVEELAWMIHGQDFKCAICREDFPHGPASFAKKKNVHVDHCHQTGKIRGVLCSNCNSALGLLKEDKQIINSALSYLATHNER